MTTLRETFAAEIAALLETAADVDAVVSRSLGDAFAQEEGDALVVHFGGEMPDHETMGVADRQSDIRISFIGRGAIPETRAEAVRKVVHPLVIGYTHAAIIDILDGPVDEPKYANGNMGLCMITAHYFIRYRTNDNSLSE